ncbi:VPS10 domain-containing protein [Sphingomonas agri]|uniref:VPS10 domain-containing protein n=1 Tax=Sphingomonas agri TaxID=1813878 RepID=UPI00311E4BB1
MRLRTNLLAAAALVSLSVSAHSASVDPSLFQDLHWRSVGPFRGGRVLAVQGDPVDAKRFYFGAVNGGVWRSDDAGRTWQPIFDQVNVGSIGAIAIAPSNPKIIYVGTGEADMRSDIAQGIGMFRSSDAGATWQAIGLSDTQQIGKILVDPRNPNVILVAALGHPYGPNEERGIFRSTDGGAHWTKTLYRDADTGAIDMAFEPGNPSVVYAALWQTRRPPWNTYPPSNGSGSGLYKSTDGGRTWHQLAGHGLPGSPARIGIATSGAKPHRVYTLIDSDKAGEGGLYRSDNSGASWTKVTGDKRIWQRGWYFGGITANPKNANQLWVQNTIQLRSDDGGAHFVPIKGDPTGDDFHTLWIDPKNPDRRILGVDQGTLVTINGGRTWSSWYNQPTAQFYHVSTDNRFPYRIYGAQQDSGAASVASRTDNRFDGITMGEFHEVTAGGESGEIAPDPDDPDVVYGGAVDRLDLKSGQTRSVDPTLAFPGEYRGEWTLPLTFGKRDHALYFGNQRLFRTMNGGQTWTPISPDLTRPDPEAPATLDAATLKDTATKGPRRGVIYDIGTSPIRDGLIWVGTDDGLIWRTDDNGAHWINVTPPQLKPWWKVGIIEPSHFDPSTAYAAIDLHRIDDQRPLILRTRDGGRTWTEITNGLPRGAGANSVNVVREDPARRGLLFAGTERSAYVSFDDGESWQLLNRDLPTTSVRDITIHGDDLVIATHGRGFYVLDDIVPLRALAGNAAPGIHLYPQAAAYRVNEPNFTGTPMPKDEPVSVNPPLGAMIDYALPATATGPVQVAIYDQSGALVSRFSSTDPVKPIDLSKLPVAPEWVVSPRPPAAGPGHHRFVWDLHYAKPAGLKEEDTPQGVWAPPGRYTVELTTNGQALRQPLTVLADPRVRVSQADFDAEFHLAKQIEAQRVRVRAMLEQARDLKESLGRLKGQADADALSAKLDRFLGEAAPIAGTSDPTTLTSVSEWLDNLAQAVDGADGAPSPDNLRGYAALVAALDAIEPRWRSFEAAARARVPAA